ncbi:hypothetical protein KP509_04G038000 [Ceratopteris richardii]|nr:hypothetical protein KP509_04G038000 [Ceratopteris richardii]
MNDALQVFHKLAFRKEYTWTSLIQGYVQSGNGKAALDLLPKMWEDNVSPSHYTYLALVKACSAMGDLARAKEVHAEIVQEGFEVDTFVSNALIDMYAKCSSLEEAYDVFEGLSSVDIVSWNTLIAGYADNLFAEKAFRCQEQMQTQGFQPDELTYLSCLKACSTIGAIEKGQELHYQIVRRELDQYPFICNGLIDMYVKCGYLKEALGVFDDMLDPDVVAWTSIMAGFIEHSLGDEVIACLERMLIEQVLPNEVTYIYALKACSIAKKAVQGQELHSEIVKRGFELDCMVGSSVVDMYAKCSLLMEAQKTFDQLPVQDTVSWNAIISAYVEAGLGRQGLENFEKLQSKGLSPNASTFACVLRGCGTIGAVNEGLKLHGHVVEVGFDSLLAVGHSIVYFYSKCGWLTEALEEFSKLLPIEDVQIWNSLISGLVKYEDCEKALFLFACMQEQGLLPDNGTFSTILKACGKTSTLEFGRRLHSQIRSSRSFDSVMGIALIDMYSRCGVVVDKHLVHHQVSTMDIVEWSAIITSYARLGETDLVLTALEEMRENGLCPNEITFLSVLSTCAHAGFLEQGQKYYDCMRKEFGIAPTMKHYNCMLDLFIRAGQIDNAMLILEEMPMQDHASWAILFGAYTDLGNEKVA